MTGLDKPVLPWFEGDPTEARAAVATRFTQDNDRAAARALIENGYAVLKLPLEPRDIAGAAAFTARGIGQYGRVQDAWCVNRHIKALATSPVLLDFLTRLYGRRAFPFQTLNFPVGTEQSAHSDTFHFNSAPARFMCGVWIALEDVTPEAGPLHYYPGSHRLPVYTRVDVPGARDEAAYSAFVQAEIEAHGYKQELACLKKGEVFIWSANLFHGGAKRTNPIKTRLSQVTHYFFEDCAYYTPIAENLDTEQHVLRDPYDLARGRTVRSRRDLIPGAVNFRAQLHQRMKIMLRRPNYFSA